MKARFHIPDFYTHFALNLNLIDMLNEHPEYFYDDIEIASCYGCFPPALWNGGRAIGGVANPNRIQSTIKEFNDRNVPIRYTFTNPTLTENDLKDAFCNSLCKSAENGFNEIIVNLPFLESYVREKYPKYPIVSSTVKQIKDLDALIEELEKDYKLVVLDYNWNNDFEKLATIPEKYRERCEILINPYCTPNCARRGEHYQVLGRCQRRCSQRHLASFAGIKNGPDPMQEAIDFNCKNADFNFYQITGFKTFINNQDIYTKYMDMGFCNFKIEGRVLNKPNVVESYVYYMVKPEYRDRIRLELLTTVPQMTFSEPPMPRLLDRDGKPLFNSDEE